MKQVLYDLPEGWEWKTVERISSKIQYGFTAKACDVGNFKLLRITDIQNGKINWDLVPFVQLGQNDKKKYLLNDNELVFARSGATAGKSILMKNTPNNAIFASYLIRIVPQIDSINPKFLAYFFTSPMYWEAISNNVAGAAQPNINGTKLSELQIPTVAFLEQERIVTKLDELLPRINKAIELLRECLILMGKTYSSALEEAFNPLHALQNPLDGKYDLPEEWEWKTIENLCSKITDGTHNTPIYIEEGIPFLSVKDISKGFINFSNTRFVSSQTHKELYKRCNPELNDILYTKVGTTGIAKVVDTEQEFSLFVSVALLKPTKEINSYFFEYSLNSPRVYQQAQQRTRGGANKNLVLRDIKEMIIPLPPLSEQEKIVEKLDLLTSKHKQSKDGMNSKIKLLEQLKASILDTAFRGQL